MCSRIHFLDTFVLELKEKFQQHQQGMSTVVASPTTNERISGQQTSCREATHKVTDSIDGLIMLCVYTKLVVLFLRLTKKHHYN